MEARRKTKRRGRRLGTGEQLGAIPQRGAEFRFSSLEEWKDDSKGALGIISNIKLSRGEYTTKYKRAKRARRNTNMQWWLKLKNVGVEAGGLEVACFCCQPREEEETLRVREREDVGTGKTCSMIS